MSPEITGRIETPHLRMAWFEAPWDSNAIGGRALQVTEIEITGPSADADIQQFEIERDRLSARLVTCRLPHDRLPESMLLEDRGFRFIEMLYRPEIALDRVLGDAEVPPLSVRLAEQPDLPELMEIAGRAFNNERFHLDPRIGARLGDQRYRNWVGNSYGHPTQELFVIQDAAATVGFFITEMLESGVCYWHLNAVAPKAQGMGYGRRTWLTMLEQARHVGAKLVRTSVVARNHRVINLYARLGFRFPPPLMTFHWVKEPIG